MFPLVVGLTVVQVSRMLLRLRAHLMGPPARRGLNLWALPP
jgi:hypothetical protein